MQDARISTALPSHPKTKKLRRKLGAEGCWSLVCLFLWAAVNHPDGNLAGMTAEDVELAIDWPGEDGAFVAALLAVGFLDGEDGSYRIHDWHEHNPWAAGFEARSLKAQWNAAKRHHGEAEADRLVPEYRAARTATSKPLAPEVPAARSAPSPSPSPSPSPLPSAVDIPPHTEGTITSPGTDSAPADAVGSFEGHSPADQAVATAKGRVLVDAATAIRAAGCKDASASNPWLVEAIRDGITASELADLAQLNADKPIKWLCIKARAQRAEAAAFSGPLPPRAAATSTRNPEGTSPRKSPEQERADEAEALAAMRRQHKELGLGPH